MPVRKIPLKYTSLSGTVFSQKNSRNSAYESSLEADFIHLLEWDLKIKYYEEQPYKIEFLDSTGKLRAYIPDFLVKFHENARTNQPFLKPIIYEVKYSKDLEANKSILKPKFEAAKAFCREEGFDFKVITEREIRTPYLENIKFLKRYRHKNTDANAREYLIGLLQKFEVATPEILIAASSQIEEKRAMLLYTLWSLVSYGVVMIDTTKKITMTSKIWLPLPL